MTIHIRHKLTADEIAFRQGHIDRARQTERTPAEHGIVDCAAAVILSPDDDTQILGVSRKDNHVDIGLPGGKCEPGESFRDCIIREVLEETGYHVQLVSPTPYDAIDPTNGNRCRTFICIILPKPREPIDVSETGVVGFFSTHTFLEGTYGTYNRNMFDHFNLTVR